MLILFISRNMLPPDSMVMKSVLLLPTQCRGTTLEINVNHPPLDSIH